MPDQLVIILAPTDEHVTVKGALCRVWTGSSLHGGQVSALIAAFSAEGGAKSAALATITAPLPAADAAREPRVAAALTTPQASPPPAEVMPANS